MFANYTWHVQLTISASMSGRIMFRTAISCCQSTATSEIVKHMCLTHVSSAIRFYILQLLYSVHLLTAYIVKTVQSLFFVSN